MGQVFVCDWCKSPTDVDSVVKIGFRDGKRWGNTWDLCSSCKEEIQTRLVKVQRTQSEYSPQTLADLDITDDRTTSQKLRDGEADDMIAMQIEREHSLRTSTKASGRSQKVQQDMPRDGSMDPDECLHANRTSEITWQFEERDMPSGKKSKIRIPFHRCTDCNSLIKHKSRAKKSRGLNMGVSEGVNFREGGGKTL